MKFRCLTLPSILLALACFALPAPADPQAHPSNLRSDILYTHRGEFVQVSPMRPLTMNAHVEQFAYDPLGLEIAVSGSETQGSQRVHFIKTVDARTGHEISRFTVTAPQDDKKTGLMLIGWSVSGKYLLLQRFTSDPQESGTSLIEFLRWDLSADPPTTRNIDPETTLPPEQQSPDLEGSAYCYPSPDGRWLLLTQSIHTQRANDKPGPDQNAFLLYDVERDTIRTLTLPPEASTYSWSDAGHLKVRQGKDRKQFDVITGEISPVITPRDYVAPAVSKQYPDLTLDTQSLEQQDTQGGDGHLDSYLIWVRRTPFGKMPLGVAAAGLMPKPQISGYPGSDDPQAAWSPTGKQVAFIANSDLCVADLTAATELLPNEKMALGLKLSCPEEQALAVSDLKQIGLGIIQYAQDSDEKFPSGDGWIKAIYPFIKSMDVFQVDGHPAVYEQPADLAVANMYSPATTEQAYMDLPCARIVLMADGHVKVFPKQETAP